MAVSANVPSRPKRAITETDHPTSSESDFNEDDYLAGRISVGLVSRCSRRLIRSQTPVARESPRPDRSSRNETHQKSNGSSTSQKPPAKAELNDKNGHLPDSTTTRPTVNIKASHAETVQLGEKFPLKSDVGEKVHTKQLQNNERLHVNNYVKRPTYVKPVNEESVHNIGTVRINSHDKGKLDSKVYVRAQPHVDEQVSATLEVKKEKVCFRDDAKRRVDAEPRQNKTYIRGNSKDTLPVQTSTREATSPKTNGKATVQVKDSKDKACVKLVIKSKEKPSDNVDYPHTAHYKRESCDETSVSPCNDKTKDNETEETADTDKVYNYLFYIGTRIPSKSFSRLCRSVNKPEMPSSPSSSSLSS